MQYRIVRDFSSPSLFIENPLVKIIYYKFCPRCHSGASVKKSPAKEKVVYIRDEDTHKNVDGSGFHRDGIKK